MTKIVQVKLIEPVWPDYHFKEQSNREGNSLVAFTFLRLKNAKNGLHYFVLHQSSGAHEKRGNFDFREFNTLKLSLTNRLIRLVYESSLFYTFPDSQKDMIELVGLGSIRPDTVNASVPNQIYFRHGNPHR